LIVRFNAYWVNKYTVYVKRWHPVTRSVLAITATGICGLQRSKGSSGVGRTVTKEIMGVRGSRLTRFYYWIVGQAVSE